MRLTLSISPCPNDTFMFDALINGRIDTRGFRFDVSFFDIEQLNEDVLSASGPTSTSSFSAFGPDISKISYAVLPAIRDYYTLLDSGSALGYCNGPVLVARPGFDVHTQRARVAVPGLHTTANLLLGKLFPALTDRHPLLFSEIAPALARGEFDAGVLIHEGRFTYADHGLELVADLGVEWERATGIAASLSAPATPLPYGDSFPGIPPSPAPTSEGLPLPLGAIVASKRLRPEVAGTIEELIRESIEYAFAHPEASREFVKHYAREMDDEVIADHIALFVNDNSLSLSPAGRLAIRILTGLDV